MTRIDLTQNSRDDLLPSLSIIERAYANPVALETDVMCVIITPWIFDNGVR
jgi:hypothetical protein